MRCTRKQATNGVLPTDVLTFFDFSCPATLPHPGHSHHTTHNELLPVANTHSAWPFMTKHKEGYKKLRAHHRFRLSRSVPEVLPLVLPSCSCHDLKITPQIAAKSPHSLALVKSSE